MKRYLLYIVIISLGTLLFAGPPIRQTAQAATDNSRVAITKNAPAPATQTAKTVTQAVQAPATTPPPTALAFDANNPATWPTCAANQTVWAQDGQCHDKQVSTPNAISSAAPAAISTGGCVTNYSSGNYYLDKIINFESGPHNGGQGGGNSCATNGSGCFGLLQACPGAPLQAACGGDPACQIEWFAANKTGGRSWQQVWQHELDYGWW